MFSGGSYLRRDSGRKKEERVYHDVTLSLEKMASTMSVQEMFFSERSMTRTSLSVRCSLIITAAIAHGPSFSIWRIFICILLTGQ
jgi:hypothetical protein